jgi:hypothetical protein
MDLKLEGRRHCGRPVLVALLSFFFLVKRLKVPDGQIFGQICQICPERSARLGSQTSQHELYSSATKAFKSSSIRELRRLVRGQGSLSAPLFWCAAHIDSQGSGFGSRDSNLIALCTMPLCVMRTELSFHRDRQ